MDMYRKTISEIYNIYIDCLEFKLKEEFDNDFQLILQDLNTDETKIYFIESALKITEKIDNDIFENNNINLVISAVTDIIFKYMFDLDFIFFNYSENYKDMFIKLQVNILKNCNWIVIELKPRD
jgi:hypothetical protein